jgi:hypothetical protein
MNSNILQINVLPGEAGVVIVVTPASIYTETAAPIATISAEALGGRESDSSRLGINLLQWLIAVVLAIAGGLGVFSFGRSRVSMRWGIRWGGCTIIGSLLGYLVGTLSGLEPFWPVTTVLAGAYVGWGVGWIWQNYPDLSRKWKDRKTNKTS